MKNDLLAVNIALKEIFEKIERRKILKKEASKLRYTLSEKEEELHFLDKEFMDMSVDIEKYRILFKTYDILIKENNRKNGTIYHCKEIDIWRSKSEQFWDVKYDTINLDNSLNNSYNNTLSLRKYTHLLDSEYASLIPCKTYN